MIKNHLISSIRAIRRDPLFSLINIFGLSISMACCLLLLLYVQKETSYDQHFSDAKDVYRVISHISNGDDFESSIVTTSSPLAQGIMDEVPGIQSVTRILSPPDIEKSMIRRGDVGFYETNGYLVDSTFFNVLDFELAEGNSKTALNPANSIVISQSFKERLFGEENALGKLVEVDNGFKQVFKVTGVLKKSSFRSHLTINYLIPMHCQGWGNLVSDRFTSWVGQNIFYTYIKIAPESSADLVTSQINDLLNRRGKTEMDNLNIRKSHDLQALTAIHFSPDSDFIEIGAKGDINHIYTYVAIAFIVLVVACINFVNLTTANANKRFNEVAIRKIVGADRGWVLSRFFIESFVMVVISLLISLVWLEVLLPFFNHLVISDISIDTQNIWGFSGLLLLVLLFTSVVSGIYPAIYLSSYQPIGILKKVVVSSGGKGLFRKYLVVFQFIVSIVLLFAISVINSQMSFIKSMDLGYSPDSKLVISMIDRESRENYGQLKSNLLQLPFVNAVTGVNAIPGNVIWDDRLFYRKEKGKGSSILTKINYADEDYIDAMGIEMIRGRNFTANDSKGQVNKNEVILNMAAVEALGFSLDDVINQELFYIQEDSTQISQVIGVINNYHHTSLHENIMPLAVSLPPFRQFSSMVVATSNNYENIPLDEVAAVWETTNPAIPFEYKFLNQHLDNQYKADKITSSILTSFTVLALIISSLGLYGLSLYAVQKRIKEIGIRKVLGANNLEILILISKEFGILTFLAFIIAFPLAYYMVNLWLNNFSYKVPIDYWLFGLSGVIALVLSQLVVSFESIRAALRNPVKSLRSD